MGLGRSRWLGLWLGLLWAVSGGASTTAEVYQTSTIGLAHRLLRLGTTARVLHIGAHPDDEDTALLTALARGEGARVAYLSLNRGEGGQNGIGPEVHDALGVVRTEELLAARGLDGAEQYFAGVYDFGFTKTLAEAEQRWGHEATLEDVVWVVRKFRPHVIIARFAGRPSDGHGQHQLAGVLAREAFRAAADPARFPEQTQLGLPPWQAARLYFDQFRPTDPGTPLEVGAWSPVYGRTWLSIAMESRSLHRSQDMGMAQPLGPREARLTLLDSTVPTDPAMAPLEQLPLALPALMPDPAPDDPAGAATIRGALADAALGVEQAAALQRQAGPQLQTIAGLAAALKALRRVGEAVESGALPRRVDPATFQLALQQKITEASEALALAAGLQCEGAAERARVVPGSSLRIACEAFWPETAPITGARATLQAPDGWVVRPLSELPLTGNGPANWQAGFEVQVPADAAPDQPWWLVTARQGDRYAPADPALRGLPLAPPRLQVLWRCVVDGAVIQLRQPIRYREVDPRRGERRLPVLIPPRLTAEVRPGLLLVPTGEARRETLQVTLRNETSEPLTGQLELVQNSNVLLAQAATVPGGRRQVLSLPVELPALSDRTTVAFRWQPDEGPAVPLTTLHEIAYEHIPPHLLQSPASLTVVPLRVTVDRARRLGYIPGPGDDLPDALARLGLSVKLLDAPALAGPDAFEGLQTIFVAPRAYEVNEALQQANRRLLDWARAGGSLVVMYQKYPFVEGQYAPWPLTMATPHDRIVDETAAVKFLAPDHPLLTTPNAITTADFDGWVQERGLYFAHTWASEYTPLLSAADPDEPARDGGLLAASLGAGHYVYCAWALFRQLPEGVPGAYRLLANLAAW